MKLVKPLAALAAMFAASAATADVSNLESYHFRHDFSTGAYKFIGGEKCSADFFNIKSTNYPSSDVDGPNGPGSAMHVGSIYGALAIAGKEVNAYYLNTNDWTLAMSCKPGSVEKGMIYSVGRLNGTNSGRIAVVVCSSSDPTKLYIQEFYRGESTTIPEKGNSVELTNLGNMASGFHTVVLVYSQSAKTVTPYVDGVKNNVLTLSSKTTTSRHIGNYQQYCSFPSISGDVEGFSRSYTNTDVAIYDLRFYLGAFSAADAAAYAALYPADRMGSPFRPDAYVEASGTNTVSANIGNYIDTGYLAKANKTRITADFQFLDTVGPQRIFGAVGNLINVLYVSKDSTFGWNMHATSYIDTGIAADRTRHVAVIDDVNGTVAITNQTARSELYGNADTMESGTKDASANTFFFAENNNKGAARYFAKARIYSFGIDEEGTLAHFFAPAIENGEAGFKDVVTGVFRGDANKDNNPAQALRFYDGVGCADDYKYENETLFAKLYATSEAAGEISVDGGAAAASAEGWVPHGGTLALAAVAADENTEFKEWTGDTWAIADGFSATDASIEVATPYAAQLRATFKPAVNAKLTVANDGADDILWSAADWRSAEDDTVSIAVPSDKQVTIVAHKSFTLALDKAVSLAKFTILADENCVVTLAGGAGGAFYATEVVVASGVLRQGTSGAFGETPVLKVEAGGTFDQYGLAPDRNTTFLLAGAGAGDWPWALTSSVAVISDHNTIDIVELAADATIGGEMDICIGVRGGATFNTSKQKWPLTLNGRTLTKTGAGELWLRRPYSTNEGTLDLAEGAIRVTGWSNATESYAATCMDNIALAARAGTSVKNELKKGDEGFPLYFKSMVLDGASMTSLPAEAPGGFGVKSSLSGHGTADKIVFAEGAVFKPDGTGYLTVTDTLAYTGKIKVDVSGLARKDAWRIPLLRVAGETGLPAPETFKIAGWRAVRNDGDGYSGYDLKKVGVMFFVR